MPEIDPVILQLKAENDQYLADLRRTTATADQQLGLQEKRVRSLEQQMKASSGEIGSTLKRLSGLLTTYFTGRELIGLLDSFTRLQNNLRVAGVEGNDLKTVQDRLFASAQKYGVEIEGLSALFSSLSQASKELGASQQQVFTVTDAVSASLKITGTSSQEASGALLQLQQVFRGSKVQAEEYNSLIDTLYPLLEAVAAGSDRWGGSVGKLTADVKASKVTTQEFFQALLKGSSVLEDKANKATLTLSAGFTTLTNALTVYFGEADKANGVSVALGEALGELAENIDTVVKALAIVATGLGVGFFVNAARARVAAFALAEGLDVASAAGLALGTKIKGVATGIIAAFGGPVGIAITAITLALGYGAIKAAEASAESERLGDVSARNEAKFLGLAKATDKAANETSDLTNAQIIARSAALGLTVDVNKLADAHYAAAAAARVQAIEEQKLAVTSAAKAANDKARDLKNTHLLPFGLLDVQGQFDAKSGAAFLNSPEYKAFKRASDALAAMMKAPVEKFAPSGEGGGGGAGAGGASTGGHHAAAVPKATGPTADETEARHQQEMSRLRQEELHAQLQITTDAQDRADTEQALLGEEFDERVKQVQNDKDFTADQKKAQIEALEKLYGLNADGSIVVNAVQTSPLQGNVEREKRQQLEQEAADLAEAQYRAADDALHTQYDLADTLDERRRIALEALDLEDKYRAEMLQSVINAHTFNGIQDQQAQLAQVALDALRNTAGTRRDAVLRQNQSPLDRYASELADPATQVEDAVVQRLKDVDQAISDAVTKELGIKDPIVAQLIATLIDQILIRPIVENLRRAQGASGGSGLGGILGAIGNAVGSLFGGGGTGVTTNTSTFANYDFSGFHAKGGTIPTGSFGIVGEDGPEPIFATPGGIGVLPNSSLRSLAFANQRITPPSQNGQGTHVAVSFTNDFRGAAPEAVAAINARLDRMQRELPGAIINTVQDARSRFILRDRR